MICHQCELEAPPDDLFCEGCGARLEPVRPAGPACICGALLADADDDGFCLGCGLRLQRPASDHVVSELSPFFAGLSDRGLQHQHNEDRFALVAEKTGFAAVVCDGVSTTAGAGAAAETVSEVVGQRLRSFLLRSENDLGEQVTQSAHERVLREAVQQAAQVLAATPCDAVENAPSTTVVAALLEADCLTVAWAGDSRAYWIDADGVHPLTEDHSWLQEMVRTGQLTTDEALGSPKAHAILRWVGADPADEPDPQSAPEVVSRTLTTAGALLLCSDGLWNYAPTAESIQVLLGDMPGLMEKTALEILERLLAFALARGGQDNVTATWLRWAPAELTRSVVEPAHNPLRMEGKGTDDGAAVSG